jgi:hypothetical protein
VWPAVVINSMMIMQEGLLFELYLGMALDGKLPTLLLSASAAIGSCLMGCSAGRETFVQLHALYIHCSACVYDCVLTEFLPAALVPPSDAKLPSKNKHRATAKPLCS